MKIIERLYVCEVCGKKSESEQTIRLCERKHRNDEKAKTMPPNAIVCPDCNGAGCDDGTDGYDSHMCGTCSGVGFVIPVKTTETKYIRIEINKN